MSAEHWRASASELARRIAGREATSREVVEAHLDRIERLNPALNAVTVVLAEEALAAADAADRALAAGERIGPLHGVPFTVKENIDLAGSATTQGVPAFADLIPAADAPIVERLRRAGAIPLGRTNMPDFGLRIHTSSTLRGLTRNPWHPQRTAGGSSGGEAAAIAAGLSPLGLGNDIGGSLRNPAHCCGIASLKPSTGRLPRVTAGPVEDPPLSSQLMFVDGPMARHVEDLGLVLSLIAGPHPRDPFAVPAPLVGPPVGERVRVAVLEDMPGATIAPGVAAAVRRAADALANAGFEVAAATPPRVERAVEVWGAWLMNELRPTLPLLASLMGADAVQVLDFFARRFPGVDVAGLVQLLAERHAIARAWAEFQAGRPLLLWPVWTRTAFPHGSDVASEEDALATFELMRPVLPANLLGLPAAVVPSAVVDGLPVGVQVIGPRFREDLCLDAAAAIESAVGRLTPIEPLTAA
ncbi:MAG: amidase [Thermodesulfobacteriota bacterium]